MELCCPETLMQYHRALEIDIKISDNHHFSAEISLTAKHENVEQELFNNVGAQY